MYKNDTLSSIFVDPTTNIKHAIHYFIYLCRSYHKHKGRYSLLHLFLLNLLQTIKDDIQYFIYLLLIMKHTIQYQICRSYCKQEARFSLLHLSLSILLQTRITPFTTSFISCRSYYTQDGRYSLLHLSLSNLLQARSTLFTTSFISVEPTTSKKHAFHYFIYLLYTRRKLFTT